MVTIVEFKQRTPTFEILSVVTWFFRFCTEKLFRCQVTNLAIAREFSKSGTIKKLPEIPEINLAVNIRSSSLNLLFIWHLARCRQVNFLWRNSFLRHCIQKHNICIQVPIPFLINGTGIFYRRKELPCPKIFRMQSLNFFGDAKLQEQAT